MLSKLKLIDIVTVIFLSYVLMGSTASNHMYILLLLFASWMVLAILKSGRALMRSFSEKKVSLLLFYLTYAFLSGLFVAPTEFLSKQFFSGILLFSPIIIFNFYNNSNRLSKLKTVVIALVLVWIVTSIRALLFYNQYDEAARELASDSSLYGDIAIGGGYGLAFGSAILVSFSILYYSYLIQKKRYRFIIWFAFLLLTIMVVFQTMSTTTFVAMVVGIIGSMMLYKTRTISDVTIRMFLLLVIGVILYLSMDSLLLMMSNFFSSQEGIMFSRLDSLTGMIAGDSSTGYYSSNRTQIPFDALKTFFKHPIFGVSYMHGNYYLNPRLYGVGNHCEWSDALANFGIIGGIPMLLIYINQCKSIFKNIGYSSFGLLLCVFILGFFNPFRTFQSHLVLFFIIPAIMEISRKPNSTISDNIK